MLYTLWSVKGGSGVTVTAAAFGAVLARRHGGAVVVDLCGDQPAALGLAQPDGPGQRDWLATPDGSAEALRRLLVPVHARDEIALLPVGTEGDWPTDRTEELVTALRSLGCPVVVDAGVRTAVSAPVGAALADAGTSLLVTRPCYLALRRASAARPTRGDLADAVVVIDEPGRALDDRDIGQALGLRVGAAIDVDPVVARAVDSGTLARRVPRSLAQPLRGLA